MRNVLLSFILIFILLPLLCRGQDKVVGPVIKMTMKMAWADIEPLASDAKGTYYLLVPYGAIMSGPVMGGNKEYSIGLLNNEMEMEKTEPLVLEYQGKELEYEFAFEISNKVMIFSSFQNQDQKKTYLFAQSVNLGTLQLSGDLRMIGEIDFSNENKYRNADFDYEFSPDSSKLLMTYSLLDEDNYILSFGYEVYSPSLERLSSWNGNLDMSDGIYLYDQFRVTNNGSVYLLTRYFASEKALKKSTDYKKNGILSSSRSLEFEANYEIRIVKFGKENQAAQIIPLEIPSQFLTLADLGVSGEDIVLIGFYSPPENVLPEGAFFMKLDESGKVLKLSKENFGDLFATPSDITNKSSGLLSDADQYDSYRFVIKDVHYKKDGGYVLSAERTVNQVKTQNAGGQVTTYSLDHTDDIAVIDVLANGDIKDVYKIEKNQQTTGLGYLFSSYYFTEEDGKLHYIFTSLGKDNANIAGKMRDTKAELVTIDQSGKKIRKELFNSDDDQITLRALDSFTTASGLILYGHENNRYARFIKIDLH